MVQKPFFLKFSNRFLFADASLEKSVNGRGEQIVVVEIKCFNNPRRDLDEFYRAVGQYITYRVIMQLNDVVGRLYLTIPLAAYERFVRLPVFTEVLHSASISYAIIDLEREEIVEWKP